MTASWVGLEFAVVHHRDGRMFRAPGLFAFVREDGRNDPLLMLVGEAEDLAQIAGPGHPQWAEALQLGMNALHLRFPISRRIDRLQLVARLVQREQPLLNLVEDVAPPLRHEAIKLRGAA